MKLRRFPVEFWRRKWTLLGLASLLALAVFFGVFPPLLAWRMNWCRRTACRSSTFSTTPAFRMAMPPSGGGMKAPAGDASPDGLTPLGRRWLRRMEEKGMVVDVAHSTDETIRAIVANAQRPVVASHAGLRGACETPGNLTDDQARGIAATGGLIAIGFWASAICDVTVDGIVKAIRYAVGVVGVKHVAFGSNFDSGAAAPVDAGELARLTHGLRAAGFSDDDIARLAGANALRVLRAVLPP